MQAQEIFDKVVAHLKQQRRPSIKIPDDIRSACAYRGDGGTKCAFGIFISDEAYDPNMEGCASDEFFIALDTGTYPFRGKTHPVAKMVDLSDTMRAEMKPLNEHQKLLRALQGAHDKAAWGPMKSEFATMNNFCTGLAEVASRHQLEFDIDDFMEGTARV
jgi:hypothetical protein